MLPFASPVIRIDSKSVGMGTFHFISVDSRGEVMQPAKIPHITTLLLGLALVTWAWLVPMPATRGQDAQSEPKEGKGKWAPLFERHAGEYLIRVVQTGTEARRLAQPVLRWWQPVRGGDDGALYIWVREGRPAAALTFFTFKWPDGTRSIVHEKASLSIEPLEATWRGNSVWRTSKPGVAFWPVPDTAAPAGSAPARLRQMVALVREFSANTIDYKGSQWPLRPLFKPLYRYEGDTDGALFAWVQGTDPEAFILLEARTAGSDSRWEFAVARFTDLEIHIRYQGREVFSGSRVMGRSSEIYHCPSAMRKPSDTPGDFD
jgi:hypothetical protein